jgi:hypothetical protein
MGLLMRNWLKPRSWASFVDLTSDMIGLCTFGGLCSGGMIVSSCHLYAFLIPGGYALTKARPESIAHLIGKI